MPDFPSSATPAEVWAYVARTLTATELTSDAGNIVRDAVLSDATRFAGQRIQASLVDTAPTEGTLLATGGEDILVEKDYTAAPVVCRLEGHIDFTLHTAGETVKIREYIQIKAAGAYVLYNETTYAGALVPPLLKVNTNWTRYKIKLTLEKTAGVNRNYDFQFFTKIQA